MDSAIPYGTSRGRTQEGKSCWRWSCVGGAILLFSAAVSGCNRTPPAPLVPPLDAGPAARTPHKTLMLHIEFANVASAKASPDPLKKAMEGVATIENGPFVLGGQPVVRFAVSIPPDASTNPVLQKVRAVAGVKNVAIR